MNWLLIAMIIGAVLLVCACVLGIGLINAPTKNDDPEWLYGRDE